MKNLKTPTQSIERWKEKEPSQFSGLPKVYQKPAAYFWGFYQHLLPSPTPLVMRMQVWIEKQTLSIDEARLLFNALVEPEREATYKFASDLLTDLAKTVAEIVRRRKQIEELEHRRKEQTIQTDPAANERIRKMIAEMGSKV